MKVLIVRNDKLGDFMLAYPSFALAKNNIINAEIHTLVPEYTKELAESCPYIDKVIIDPGKKAGFRQNIKLFKLIKQEKYDAVITLYTTTRIGILMALARIPYRLSPATKLAQIFYNHRLSQRRSRSEKPEYVYNMDLVEHFLAHLDLSPIYKQAPPFLNYDKQEIEQLKNNFFIKHSIPLGNKLIFIHPGSGGSATNLTPAQFAELATKIKTSNGHTIVVTAGPSESNIVKDVVHHLQITNYTIFNSTQGLVDFSKHIQFADLFISGSTGPLHIAGALDTPTVGFYPIRRSATALRWQTLNSRNNRIAFSPSQDSCTEDLSSINIDYVATVIQRYLDNE